MRKTPLILASAITSALVLASPVEAGGSPTFDAIPLLRPDGSSENAISISRSGQMALTSLSWTEFGTNTWLGQFGSQPGFVGQFDANLAPGIGGGGDADVDLGSTGTLHLTSLIFFFNPVTKIRQLGVSSVACPNADVAGNFAHCKSQVIDTTQADRQWITSRGSTVWIAYHDSGSSSTVHVQRSLDDGFTWRRVGDPIVGHGGSTGASTFNNDNGPIVADPNSSFIFDVFAAGTASVQKGTSADFNQVFVSRSNDGGLTWQASLVFSAPPGSILNNVFPSLAVDAVNGDVYATWSDRAAVWVARSTDHGASWSAPVRVSTAPLNTAVFPWIAARNGLVDSVYYGTTSTSKDSPTAVWNVFLGQSMDFGATFTQTLISPHPNHVGPICTNGIACAPGTRNLLDLFEVALTPGGKAGVIYTDDTISKQPDGSPLPQAVLAMQT
jgi:hypothetical protein